MFYVTILPYNFHRSEWEDWHELLYPWLLPLYHERTWGVGQGTLEQHGKWYWFLSLSNYVQNTPKQGKCLLCTDAKFVKVDFYTDAFMQIISFLSFLGEVSDWEGEVHSGKLFKPYWAQLPPCGEKSLLLSFICNLS